MSLQSHILQEEARYPGSTGDFTWILSAISLAAKAIANKVRVARLEDVLGDEGGANVHGETQQKLDVIANELLITCLGSRPSLAVVASEEDEEPTILRRATEGGKYCVIFDPLDGSSNLDVSVGVGTIFSILRNDANIPGAVETLCQPGSQQVAAGYILYGSSTVFVLTTGNGVDLFVLDPIDRLVRAGAEQDPHPADGEDVFGQRSEPAVVSRCDQPLSRLGARQWLLRAATSARWSPTSIARCSRAASSCIRRRRRTPRASCG